MIAHSSTQLLNLGGNARRASSKPTSSETQVQVAFGWISDLSGLISAQYFFTVSAVGTIEYWSDGVSLVQAQLPSISKNRLRSFSTQAHDTQPCPKEAPPRAHIKSSFNAVHDLKNWEMLVFQQQAVALFLHHSPPAFSTSFTVMVSKIISTDSYITSKLSSWEAKESTSQ